MHVMTKIVCFFFFSSRRRHTRFDCDWSSDVCSSDLTTLFTIDHFVRELDSLRAHLGCQKVHLFGHSWGTILAFEYYRAHPEHVASLTLGSAALDIPTWARNARQLVGTLSGSAQRALRVREAPGHS